MHTVDGVQEPGLRGHRASVETPALLGTDLGLYLIILCEMAVMVLMSWLVRIRHVNIVKKLDRHPACGKHSRVSYFHYTRMCL